jgi:hypothetical protein
MPDEEREFRNGIGRRSQGFAWQRVIGGLITLGVVALVTWFLTIERRVSTLEAEQFTDKDAAILVAPIYDALQTMREVIAELPPDQFESKVARMDMAIRDIELYLARTSGFVPGGERSDRHDP